MENISLKEETNTDIDDLIGHSYSNIGENVNNNTNLK